MESDQIQALLAELSTDEQQEFEQLLLELKSVKGDLSQLSEEYQLTLTKLAQKHMPQPEEPKEAVDEVRVASESITATEIIDDSNNAVFAAAIPETSPIETPFGQYVIEQLKTLCEGGSSLADAVRYAFHNKYLPYHLREELVCKDILQRYQADILTIADSFKELESAHHADAKLLVGFAWFGVVFDCYQYIETYGELP